MKKETTKFNQLSFSSEKSVTAKELAKEIKKFGNAQLIKIDKEHRVGEIGIVYSFRFES